MILYGTNPIAWSNDDDWTLGDHLSLDDCLTDCRKIGYRVATSRSGAPVPA